MDSKEMAYYPMFNLVCIMAYTLGKSIQFRI